MISGQRRKISKYMEGITVTMAIVDFIPVLLFFAAAVILLKDLYNKLVKGAYALLAAGSIMVFIGGFYKALWKFFVGAGICNYPVLEESLFPLQGPGFLLIFAALIGLFTKANRKNVTLHSSALPIVTGILPFLFMQIVGSVGTQAMLVVVSVKMKKKLPVVCFVLSFIFIMAMGYLGAKFDDSSSMNWVAQCTNIVSQGSLLAGVWMLHKAGLGEKDALFD